MASIRGTRSREHRQAYRAVWLWPSNNSAELMKACTNAISFSTALRIQSWPTRAIALKPSRVPCATCFRNAG